MLVYQKSDSRSYPTQHRYHSLRSKLIRCWISTPLSLNQIQPQSCPCDQALEGVRHLLSQNETHARFLGCSSLLLGRFIPGPLLPVHTVDTQNSCVTLSTSYLENYKMKVYQSHSGLLVSTVAFSKAVSMGSPNGRKDCGALC